MHLNTALLQRPTRVHPRSNTAYLYAPAHVTEQSVLKVGEPLYILDVAKGKTPSETLLKVMSREDWINHAWRRGCVYTNREEVCECEKPVEEMQPELKAKVHFVLMSDIGC